MPVIAELKAMLGMDATKFKKGMQDSKKETQSFKNQISSVGKSIATAFSIGAIVSFGKSLTSYAANIGTAANNVGLMSSELIAFNKVAVETGVKTEQVQSMFAKLQNAIADAARNGGIAEEKFSNMGVSLDDLIKMDAPKQMREVGKAALNSASPVEALSDIFGERLGPNARTFMESVINGMPEVDASIENTIDQAWALDDAWAGMMDNVKTTTLSVIGRMQRGFEGLYGYVSNGGMKYGLSLIGLTLAAKDGIKGMSDAVNDAESRDNAAFKAKMQKRLEERKANSERLAQIKAERLAKLDELKDAAGKGSTGSEDTYSYQEYLDEQKAIQRQNDIDEEKRQAEDLQDYLDEINREGAEYAKRMAGEEAAAVKEAYESKLEAAKQGVIETREEIEKNIEKIDSLKQSKKGRALGENKASSVSIGGDQLTAIGGALGGADRSAINTQDRASQMGGNQVSILSESLKVNKEIRTLQKENKELFEKMLGVNKDVADATKSMANLED